VHGSAYKGSMAVALREWGDKQAILLIAFRGGPCVVHETARRSLTPSIEGAILALLCSEPNRAL